ncbi:MAG: hypothetical protein IAE80_18980 [Anaerolinea sp.]|nr:hypothetical protein [Anaerolinea sp.]
MTDVPVTPARRSPIRRIGCTVLLIFWFTLLLLPCALFVLATQGEISISQGGLPGQHIRLWLINEMDERGLGVSSTSVTQTDPNAACIQTNASFLLWAGQAEPLSYCDCYVRADADSAWQSASTAAGECASVP